MVDHLLLNIEDIKQRISEAARRAGRDPREITLVAVSKTVDIDQISRAFEYGLVDFGENRSRELARKYEHLTQARWHMIGQLQSNKVKEIVGKACLVHSLDRWSLAEALNREGERQSIVVDALVEVNVAGEEQKAGVNPGELEGFLQQIKELPYVRVLGLMTMAPASDDPEDSRPVFKQLHTLFSTLKDTSQGDNVRMQHLSMGMSQDFEVAVEEGADIIRVGTAIFGKISGKG